MAGTVSMETYNWRACPCQRDKAGLLLALLQRASPKPFCSIEFTATGWNHASTLPTAQAGI